MVSVQNVVNHWSIFVDLKQVQEKIKIFSSKRDQIIGEIGREEGQLENACNKLKELGVENPEKLTKEELEALTTRVQKQLNEKVATLEEQLKTGEDLINKYQALGEE